MPEAGGCQVTVTASVQVSSAAKTQPSSDLSTETKRGGDRRGGEDFITETAEKDDDSRGRGYEDVTYLKKAERVKRLSSFHISQLSASQPGGRKCRGGTEKDNQTRVQQRPRRKLYSYDTVKANISLEHRDVRRRNMYLCSILKQFYNKVHMSTRKMHFLKDILTENCFLFAY